MGVAQSKYDMGAATLVENYRQAATLMGVNAAKAGDELTTLIVSIDSPAVVENLRELGVEIVDISNDVALVNIPVKNIEAMASLDGVRSIETGRMQQPMMYFARSSANADVVLDGNGAGLTQAYKGNGIVTGLMDQGIDPNHVAFYNEELTATRVKAVYTYMGNGATGSPSASYTTPDAIAGFRCDSPSWTHGTHVASIMAGGYNGTSDYALSRRIYNSQPMPFYGLASASDIVMCGGNLYDANIMDGVAKVIDYAKSVGKPAVVNLSLGSTVGPHDGTSSLSRYLAGKGEEGIIVIAAGNEGDTNCALNANFNRLSSMIISAISVTSESDWCTAEFWYDTSDAFNFEFLLYNTSTGKETSYAVTETGRTVTIGTSDATFGAAFASGSQARLYANVDPNNNRYYVRLQMLIPRGASSNRAIVPGIRIKGSSGHKLMSTINNGQFTAQGISGATAGTAMGSISDMATGANIIVAGAYTSSKYYTNMAGNQMSYVGGTDNGQVCSFTSYGQTYQGASLPDLCAPGSIIVAAVNNYAYTSPTTSEYCAVANFNNRKNYWAEMQGTSMACPFISGTVALMLEADPTLDVNKARTILKETAGAPPSSTTSDQKMQWGAGRIDVLAAVKKTLDEKAGVGAILADDARNFILTRMDGGYNVFVAGEASLAVTVYDASGRAVAAASAAANSV
ncbi:MAG: S8 family serine peptidase, partial [Muribaculaceae bacterium]|nr:S8 family serine peptidase [Muribaculaceae bacterium]